MTTRRLKPVPSPDPETRHVDLDGELAGHWVEYHAHTTGRQTIALLRAKEDFASALEVVGQRTVAHSFGGDILDQPLPTITAILKAWTAQAQEDAVSPKAEPS